MLRFTQKEAEHLLYRRQFVLGPDFLEKLPSWQKAKIGNNFFLQAHSDLELTQVKRDNVELTLLGYLIDPDNPEFNNQDILESILSCIVSAHDIFEATYRLGGRWIIILDNEDETILFNDASGLRQAFYTDGSVPQLWCASQPKIVAEELGLTFDKETERDFIDSRYFKETKEIWWPGDSSPFKEMRRLLPNRYLDLNNGTSHRYWPNKRIANIPLEEGIRKGSELLKALMNSVHKRFKLAFTLTAGWDTRVLLAASREVSKDMFYLTLMYDGLTEESRDIRISSRLLAGLGLEHHVGKCPPSMDSEFQELYSRNVNLPNPGWGSIAQGLYEHLPKDRVCVRGAISSEIVKLFASYYQRALAQSTSKDAINARTLSRLGGEDFKENAFAVRQFDKWLSEAREPAEKYNINILELFGWEQMTGCWQAMSQLETDISCEQFIPYNCRELLTTLISVDRKYRLPPGHRLYAGIINNLWPEVLSEPINPTPLKIKIRDTFKELLVLTNTYLSAKSLARKKARIKTLL